MIPVRPGTDRFLATAVIRLLIERDRISSDILAHTTGWDEFRECVLAWPVSKLSDACGVSVEDIERAATKAFIEERNLRLFQIPKTEISELSQEAREALDLDSAQQALNRNGDKIVIVPAKRDTNDELLGELSKYGVDPKYTREEEMEVWESWRMMSFIVQKIIEKEEGGIK